MSKGQIRTKTVPLRRRFLSLMFTKRITNKKSRGLLSAKRGRNAPEAKISA
jgi:hypothetical protein